MLLQASSARGCRLRMSGKQVCACVALVQQYLEGVRARLIGFAMLAGLNQALTFLTQCTPTLRAWRLTCTRAHRDPPLLSPASCWSHVYSSLLLRQCFRPGLLILSPLAEPPACVSLECSNAGRCSRLRHGSSHASQHRWEPRCILLQELVNGAKHGERPPALLEHCRAGATAHLLA